MQRQNFTLSLLPSTYYLVSAPLADTAELEKGCLELKLCTRCEKLHMPR